MKILCVVTGEALIDGRGMGWVQGGAGGGGRWRAVQDMMVEVLPALAQKKKFFRFADLY